MRTFRLQGHDLLDNKVLAKSLVVSFMNDTHYFRIKLSDITPEYLWLITPKGSYKLLKNPSNGDYHGLCNEHKVNVHLKKVVGNITYY